MTETYQQSIGALMLLSLSKKEFVGHFYKEND